MGQMQPLSSSPQPLEIVREVGIDSANLFEDFFENGGVPLHIVDGDGIILRANHAELKLLGYEHVPAEYIGHHIAEFHADQCVISDILRRLQSGEALTKVPAQLLARDGSIKHVEITSSGCFRDGKFHNTRCFTIDVTELVLAKREAQHKDMQFKQVLDALPAAIYMTDATGAITYCNNAAVEFAGREPVLGKDNWCVTFRLRDINGNELPHEQCPMAIALKERRPVRGVEAIAQRPDGTQVPFLPFPTPLFDENGEVFGAVNMLVDISERRQAEANMRLLLDELNHRVKNNLQMLYGLLDAAHRDTDNPEAKSVLKDASQRVAVMAAAQRLLYSEENPREFSIPDFLQAVAMSARQAFDESIKVRLEGKSGSLPGVLALPLALILNELVTNSGKHGVGSRTDGEIAIGLWRADGAIFLSVEDNGPGFELLPHGRRSSGLGLVKGLLRQLGGQLSVERGDGCRCVVRLPDQASNNVLER